MIEQAAYIKVEARVRYWEDARINGTEDETGTLTPFRKEDTWCPIIQIKDGVVVDWPKGMEADFHFKVCDAGTYYLLNENMEVIASIINDYVPDGLCHGDRGYGDYIIFKVNDDGSIQDYKSSLNEDEWDFS